MRFETLKEERIMNWHRTNYAQAIELLKDDKLVWSSDFDQEIGRAHV